MRQGHLELDGDTESTIARYHELMSVDGHSTVETARSGGERMYLGGVEIIDRTLDVGSPDGVVSRDRPVTFRLRVRFTRPTASPVFGMTVVDEEGRGIYSKHTEFDTPYAEYAAGDEAELSMSFMPRLTGGTYEVQASVMSMDGRAVLARTETGTFFFMTPLAGTNSGLADLEGRAAVDGQAL
jgi:hypothetical protein